MTLKRKKIYEGHTPSRTWPPSVTTEKIERVKLFLFSSPRQKSKFTVTAMTTDYGYNIITCSGSITAYNIVLTFFSQIRKNIFSTFPTSPDAGKTFSPFPIAIASVRIALGFSDSQIATPRVTLTFVDHPSNTSCT